MPTSLAELAINIHSANRKKGFYDNPPSALEIHALITTEVAEATEAVRKGLPDSFVDENGKPQGEAFEIIDVIIRCFDYCGHKGWDVDELIREKLAYNLKRPYKHGKKM